MSEPHDDLIARAIRRAADGVAPITLAEVQSRGPIDDPGDVDDLVASNGKSPERSPRPATIGEPIMVIELERSDTTEPTPVPPKRRLPWVLAAAAALVLVVFAAAALWDAGEDDGPLQVAPADEPGDAPSGDADASAPVDRFLDIYNAGDWEAIQAVLAEDLDPTATNTEHRRVKQIDPAYVVAGDRWTRTGPCRTSGDQIICPIERRDDFHGAAGITTTADYAFEFDDRGRLERLNLVDADPWADQHAFRLDFREWVEQERTDASIRFFAPAETSIAELGDLPLADSMTGALAIVDDFVAQSDRWGP